MFILQGKNLDFSTIRCLLCSEMSKKKRHRKKRTIAKRNVKKKKKMPLKRGGQKKKTTVKRSRSVMAIILALFGIFGTVFGIWSVVKPRISVHTGDPHNPSNPVLTPFVIRNDGHLSIRDVKCSNAMKEIVETDMDVTIIGLGDYSNRFSDLQQVARVIRPEEEYSIQLYFSKLKHHQFGKMDIAIVISFRPIKWLSWRKESLYRFVTRLGEDGQWHWQPMPIKK